LAVDTSVYGGVEDEVYVAVGEVAFAALVDVYGVLILAYLAYSPMAMVACGAGLDASSVADAFDSAYTLHNSERTYVGNVTIS
jgi:hypothetical protein